MIIEDYMIIGGNYGDTKLVDLIFKILFIFTSIILIVYGIAVMYYKIKYDNEQEEIKYKQLSKIRYQCLYCKQIFKASDLVRKSRHITRYSHEGDSPVGDEETYFNCIYCDKDFTFDDLFKMKV